jgi:hypothetical protein
MTMKVILILIFFLVMIVVPVCAQESFDKTRENFDTYRTRTLQEKIFVHVDRSFYQSGETMWFKIYVVDGTLHKPVDISAVAYLEVMDDSNKRILQTKIQLKDGKGNGSLLLSPSINTGNYVIRAYTNWMKNFSPEFYYQQSITILNVMREPVEENVARTAQTGYDVQFFPEGGHLVSGLTSKVGFRSSDRNGNSIEFSGAVVNADNDTIVKFHPTHFGIGGFMFTPLASQSYRVIVKDTKNTVFTYSLPTIEAQGYVMMVKDSSGLLEVNVSAKFPDGQPETIHLLAHTRNQIVSTQSGQLVNGKVIFLIDKKLLPDGITHITLFNKAGSPVSERLCFKRPAKNLAIEAKSNSDQYGIRKKIEIDLETKSLMNPVPSNLSIAVFRMDSLQSHESVEIGSYLLLTSDLRGTVESPSWYFSNTGKESDEALDNLMLTHGWSRFSWENILKPADEKILYMPEQRSHVITAKISDAVTNLPAPQVPAFLSTPGTGIRLYTSRSNDHGEVMFEVKDFFNQNKIVLQTNLLQDSTYKIEMNDPFSANLSSFRAPLFQPTAYTKARESILSQSIHTQVQYVFYSDSVRSAKVKKDTVAFYGTPDEHYLLDDYTRFTTMEDVMREYVADLQVRKKSGKLQFWVLDQLSGFSFKGSSVVLVDGVPVFDMQKIMDFDPLKVQSLDIVTRRYFIGPAIFDGIVSYKTYSEDLAGFPLDPKVLIQNYEGVQGQREFYAPRYDDAKQFESRLPDFRDLLYWNANVETGEDGKSHLEFYTSDQPGKYKVIIQGITSQGIPGDRSFTFDVNPPER